MNATSVEGLKSQKMFEKSRPHVLTICTNRLMDIQDKAGFFVPLRDCFINQSSGQVHVVFDVGAGVNGDKSASHKFFDLLKKIAAEEVPNQPEINGVATFKDKASFARSIKFLNSIYAANGCGIRT
jgi:hypothetical protein